MNLSGLLQYIMNRLKEPSTWRGLIALATAAGLALSPEQKETIIGLGVTAISAILIFKKDANSVDAKPKPEPADNTNTETFDNEHL